MPETGNPGAAIEVRCIALAVDCSALNRAALDTAVTLAAATRARLHVVFVEDECLFDMAALSVARQVSASGREAGAIDADVIEHGLRRASEAARRAVSAAAARAHVDWGFDTMRGLLDEALGRVGKDAEILALGSCGGGIGRAHAIDTLRRVLRHGTGLIVAPSRVRNPSGPIVALIGPGAHPETIVRTAEKIAGRAGRAHRFVVLGASVDERRALADIIAEVRVEDAPVTLCAADTLAAVSWRVREEGAGLVIADIDYACFDEARTAERLGEALAAPLLLVQV